DYPQGSLLRAAQEKLWDANIAMLFSRTVTDDSYVYEVQPGDTLYKIAKKYNTNVDLLMKSNGLEQSLIKPGMRLKIIKSVFSIEVSKSQNKLILKADGNVVKEYPIGIGDNNSTPVGQFKITSRIVSPVWYKTGAIVPVPAGSAENILGSRWMGLSEPGYGIHGTTDTKEITKQRTQGCVRMWNKEVEELFVIVPVGTEVIIND
ncbi:MAG: L,D-transpeptidase family protein, partial [Candidatus Omnitrophica bacterium]|nr:L,D-transpeptidase family protein [Candidatus Omnitrophota bacterium]MCG2704153.1 L,D-transpeptidase family protein [Candidatus Omnitrophota bacterium]